MTLAIKNTNNEQPRKTRQPLLAFGSRRGRRTIVGSANIRISQISDTPKSHRYPAYFNLSVEDNLLNSPVGSTATGPDAAASTAGPEVSLDGDAAKSCWTAATGGDIAARCCRPT